MAPINEATGARLNPKKSIGSVIIFTSEDGLEDTLVPRLIAARADMRRVHFVRGHFDENLKKRGFNLQADLAMLENEIRARGDVRLVDFDPVTSYLGKIDSHKNADVRSILDPLSEMADRMRVAVVCNNHLNKGDGSANSRIIGSVAFVNHARSAFIVTPDENDKTRRLLIPSKTNIGPEQYGLAYRIEGCLIEARGTEIRGRLPTTASRGRPFVGHKKSSASNRREMGLGLTARASGPRHSCSKSP